MHTGKEKLGRDLKILEAMAAKMKDYLNSDELFWPKIDSDPVQPTLGGYLMRQHRLRVLQDLVLDDAQRKRLEAAITKFNQAILQTKGRFEEKAARELEARLRQWDTALEELLQDDPPSLAYYQADVETRAMIAALIDELRNFPAQFSSENVERLDKLDHRLRQRWQPGEFIWPEIWKPAYPKAAYWWLYGQIG